MPRGRKSTAAARSAAGAQSRLSFNNRVTKTSTQAQTDEPTASAKKLSQIDDTLSQDESEVAEVGVKDGPETKSDEEEDEETSEILEEVPEPSRAGARRKAKTVKGKDEREVAAEKITDAQLKKYWQKEEESRLAPRGEYDYDLFPEFQLTVLISSPRSPSPPRENSPTFRPLQPVRPLHRHPSSNPVAPRKHSQPQPTHRSTRRSAKRRRGRRCERGAEVRNEGSQSGMWQDSIHR